MYRRVGLVGRWVVGKVSLGYARDDSRRDFPDHLSPQPSLLSPHIWACPCGSGYPALSPLRFVQTTPPIPHASEVTGTRYEERGKTKNPCLPARQGLAAGQAGVCYPHLSIRFFCRQSSPLKKSHDRSTGTSLSEFALPPSGLYHKVDTR